MDVHCLNCGEPWDTYHLRHDVVYDAIFDGGLWPDIRNSAVEGADCAQMVRLRWPEQKLDDYIRSCFRNVGWEFGANVIIVLHCPSCKDNKKPDDEALAKAKAVGDLLGDDLDGTASLLSE